MAYMLVTLSALFAGGFAFGARLLGLVVVVPHLAATALAVSALLIVTLDSKPGNWMWIVIGMAVGAVLGAGFGSFYRRHAVTPFFRAAVRFYDNKQFLVIAASLLSAVLVTFVFSKLATIEPDKVFWKGFYQSWTAAVVAFVFLGLAGLLVTFYSPTKDQFQRRVSNLFDVHDAAATEYLSKKAQEIAYYATEVKRTYEITDYDSTQRAYKIKVTHKTTNKNFLKDVHAPDKARLSIQFEAGDLLSPPKNDMGELVSVIVAGQQRLTAAKTFGAEGLEEQWSYTIPAGGEAVVEVVYWCWYKAETPHSYGGSRFARRIDAEIVDHCSNGPHALKVGDDEAAVSEQLTRGRSRTLSDVADYVPGKPAFLFTLSPVAPTVAPPASPPISTPVAPGPSPAQETPPIHEG